MFEDVKNIMIEQLHVTNKEITEQTRIKEDLGADSLDILQLLMTLEEQRGVTIPDEALATFETVGDIVEYLEKH